MATRLDALVTFTEVRMEQGRLVEAFQFAEQLWQSYQALQSVPIAGFLSYSSLLEFWVAMVEDNPTAANKQTAKEVLHKVKRLSRTLSFTKPAINVYCNPLMTFSVITICHA